MVRENFELGLHEVISTNQFSKLAELCLTFPLTVSSAERSFSALKHIKDRLRVTMADERLCNLSIISVEKKIAKSLKFGHVKFFPKTRGGGGGQSSPHKFGLSCRFVSSLYRLQKLKIFLHKYKQGNMKSPPLSEGPRGYRH